MCKIDIAAVEVVKVDWIESDVFADEILELSGGDFAEAFETRDLVTGQAALVGILVIGHIFPHVC